MADLPVPATGAEEVRRIADSVLARQEFLGAQPTWWQRLLRWVIDFFESVAGAVGGDGRGSAIGIAMILLLVLAALYVVVRFTRSVRRDPATDFAMDAGIGRTTREWIAEAKEHETAQRWRDAIRCRYRALLADLAAAGLVDEIAGRTSGEYLAAVREDVPGAAEDFADVTRRFEQAWYGHDASTSDHVEPFVDAARRTAAAAGLRRSLVASDV